MVTIQSKLSGQVVTLPPCDLVVKATGTTWEVPVANEELEHAYSDLPQHSSLWHYIQKLGKLDSEGIIVPGTRILIGGSGLSAYDHIGILLAMTRIVKINPSAEYGFTIDASIARQNSEFITLFSTSADGILPARQYDMTCSRMSGMDKIVTPEMLFSVRLQKDMDPFSTCCPTSRCKAMWKTYSNRRLPYLGKND